MNNFGRLCKQIRVILQKDKCTRCNHCLTERFSVHSNFFAQKNDLHVGPAQTVTRTSFASHTCRLPVIISFSRIFLNNNVRTVQNGYYFHISRNHLFIYRYRGCTMINILSVDVRSPIMLLSVLRLLSGVSWICHVDLKFVFLSYTCICTNCLHVCSTFLRWSYTMLQWNTKNLTMCFV